LIEKSTDCLCLFTLGLDFRYLNGALAGLLSFMSGLNSWSYFRGLYYCYELDCLWCDLLKILGGLGKFDRRLMPPMMQYADFYSSWEDDTLCVVQLLKETGHWIAIKPNLSKDDVQDIVNASPESI